MYIPSDFKTYLNFCEKRGLKPCYITSLELYENFKNEMSK